MPNSTATSTTALENPHSSMHITVHKFTGKNYLQWPQSMKLAIDGRGRLGYLTAEIKTPEEGDKGYKTWRSENSLVTPWLLNSMETSIAKLWDAVRETYSDLENSSQIFELKTRLWQSKQGNRDVTTTTTTLWHYGKNWISARRTSRRAQLTTAGRKNVRRMTEFICFWQVLMEDSMR